MERSDWKVIFSESGAILASLAEGSLRKSGLPGRLLNAVEQVERSMVQAVDQNPWFTPENVRFAMRSWGKALEEEKVEKWLSGYPAKKDNDKEFLIGVVMAGNIPMVGFHDMLCVLASGNRLLARLSSKDDRLLPAIAKLFEAMDERASGYIQFTEGTLKGFDAVIATGSNNSSRYFEYYFGKYPHIIRKNRNGVAVINGHEGPGFMAGLEDDILMYFGLGCRNVSKIWLPEHYDLQNLVNSFGKYGFIADHSKYRNNYDYQKSIFIINQIPFYDNGYLLIKEDQAISSAVSVLNYEFYKNREELEFRLAISGEAIQCIVSEETGLEGAIPAGTAQQPGLWDYADGIDTMKFLTEL